MERLARLREERKKLEMIESQVLSAPPDDAQSLHAWAARELKQLSESIRNGEQSDLVELKTARGPARFTEYPSPEPPQQDENTNPKENVPNVDFEGFTEIPPIKSEARIEINTVTSTELSSLTPSVSVSVDDEFSSESVRSCSPAPLTQRRFIDLNEVIRSEGQHPPMLVLDSILKECESKEERRRKELGEFAKDLLQGETASTRRASAREAEADLGEVAKQILNHKTNQVDKMPPLVSATGKQTKSGTSSFNNSRRK